MHGYHLTVQHLLRYHQQQVLCNVQNVRGRYWCDHDSRLRIEPSVQ
jgi:hypothetical protein